MLESFTSTAFWFQVLASTTPVLLATLGANIVTKAGIFNLGIEGTMLICSLVGVLGSAYTHSLVCGMLLGILAGIMVSWLLGYFALVMQAPMNSCGVAINLLAAGGTVFVLTTLTGSKVTSSSLPSLTYPIIHLPLINRIPILGEVLSGHNLITYLAWLMVAFAWVLLFRTDLGRSIRAVGENEEAAKSAGIRVNRMKFLALALCGLFSSFGGMYMSMGSLRSFTAGMTAGRGYLSLAMDAMSKGNPILGFASSLLYGFFDSITVYLQMYSGLDLKLISAMPYIFIIVVLFVVQRINRSLVKKKLAANIRTIEN